MSMASMRIELNRTGRKVVFPNIYRCYVDAFGIIKDKGYERVTVLDLENQENVLWEYGEFNRLCVKDGIIYRFNGWVGKYPYEAVEIEEIGIVKEQ